MWFLKQLRFKVSFKAYITWFVGSFIGAFLFWHQGFGLLSMKLDPLLFPIDSNLPTTRAARAWHALGTGTTKPFGGKPSAKKWKKGLTQNLNEIEIGRCHDLSTDLPLCCGTGKVVEGVWNSCKPVKYQMSAFWEIAHILLRLAGRSHFSSES